MNSAATEYVVALLQDSLGLAEGALAPDLVPRELAELVVEAVKGSESSAAAEPLLEQRISNFLEEFEEVVLDRDGFFLRKARWPAGAPYAACLTHDVDNISKPLSHIIGIRERFSRADILLALLGLRSLYNNIAYVASLEEERRLRSSFFLLSASYNLSAISSLLNKLKDEGWDIGLHGDFGTYNSAEKMAAAVARFRAQTGLEPRGLREHFLQFDYGTSWGIINSQGFDYDTSVGNRNKLGFRLGLCTPFHPPDASWRPIQVLEVPLVLMDTTLWGYLKRTEEDGIKDFVCLKDKVARVEGLYTILWHQEALRMKGGRLYARLLDTLLGDGCYIGSGAAIARWWDERARSMTFNGNEFSMEGSPQGLCLRFKAKEERNLSLDGGRVEMKAADTTINTATGGFKLRVT